jgi:hypothetical protein
MSCRKYVVTQHALDAVWKPQQSKGISDRRPTPSYPLSHLLLGHLELVCQPVVRLSLLERVEVIAMEVLDHSMFKCGSVIGGTDYRWDRGETDLTCSTPATLSCHNFVAISALADQDWLQNTYRLY